MMNNKLKPCPFCGEKNNLTYDGLLSEIYWIRCGECCATGPTKDTMEEAIKEWNSRAEPDQVDFSPEWLMSERQRHGLSKNELGRRIGVSSTSIRKWENGQCRPKEMVLRKLKEELEGDAD